MSDGTTDKKIAAAVSERETELWMVKVDETLKDHGARLTHTDTVLDAINIHLARIDTNLQWFKTLTKWVLGLAGIATGGAGGVSFFG
jgi:hypothetical protein